MLADAPIQTPPPLEGSDARWVLAVRVAERLEGTMLDPESRERLVRLGKMLGLTPFDANLVIAIVQDRARRGIPAMHCPAAAAEQLATLTPPLGSPAQTRSLERWSPTRRAMVLAGVLTLIEVAAVWAWLS